MNFKTGDRCSYYCDKSKKTYEFTIRDICKGYHPYQSGWEGTDWCIPREVEDIKSFCLSDIKLIDSSPQQYHLYYTIDGDFKLKSFDTESEMHKYMAELLPKAHTHEIHLDFAFKGEILIK